MTIEKVMKYTIISVCFKVKYANSRVKKQNLDENEKNKARRSKQRYYFKKTLTYWYIIFKESLGWCLAVTD